MNDNDKIKISAIAAMATNRVIGREGGMPWHIPGDLKHFKKTTMGKPIIMGRKSYESLGQPLPGRTNIVISRSLKSLSYQNVASAIHNDMEAVARDVDIQENENLVLCASIEEAVEKGREIAQRDNLDEIFIAGGGEIYKAALPVTDRIYLTVIDRDYDGDTYFPEFDQNEWQEISSERYEGDPSYDIKIFEK